MPVYRHTQVGWLVIISLIAGLALCAVVVNQPVARWIAGGVGLVLLASLLLFWSLTIEVNSREVVARFGVGVVHKRFSLMTICGVKTVRNRWWYGWGVRLTPHGWMFNVSGFEAVELELDTGKRFRLGTDQPQQLREAIERAVAIAGGGC